MNKVTTINLDGRAYQIEEAGFDALHSYLEDAKAKLANDPGAEEIIGDIERALAEKCDERLHPHKTVITAEEIRHIIEEMGPVEAANAAEGADSAQGPAQGPKRLYLLREGALCCGVCTGLAAYFDVDVTLVRIIFAILTIFTGGVWVLVYLALALLIPYADTEEAKAAARGEQLRAENIVKRAKERFEEGFKRVTGENWDSKHWDRAEWHRWKHDLKREMRQWKYEAKQWKYTQRRYQRRNPLIGLLLGALGILWILALISLISTGAIFGWLLPASIPLWLAVILLFIAYHAVTGPMKSARYMQGPDGYAYSEWDGLVDGLTVLFLIIASVWAYLHIPQVYEFVHHPIESTQAAIQWFQSLIR